MENSNVDPSVLATLAKSLQEPSDYFNGKDWSEELLPKKILCFSRLKQSETGGWGGITATPGRYDQHRRFVLLVALEGRGRVGVETNLWNLVPGDAVLMFPHQVHYYPELEEGFCWLFITFELERSKWGPLEQLRDNPRRLTANAMREMGAFLSKWQKAEEGGDVLLASASLGRLLKGILQGDEVAGVAQNTELVGKVREYVQTHLTEDLSVNSLSLKMDWSGSYLRERFREEAGVSLGHYVRSVRLMKATELLRDTDEGVGDIAKQCGFGSFTSFSRAFGQVYGTSPSEYRKSLSEE
ncbi:MAG: AraC family transcriptional regulator [Verrucomicrobiota bacterium JB023]|nr:AraC family transcriptional regulator [Verrucomicrobiota bacterium JB023]